MGTTSPTQQDIPSCKPRGLNKGIGRTLRMRMNFNFFSFVLGQDLHSYHHPAFCWLIIKSIRLVSWGWWCKWPCGFGHIRTLSSWLLILCDCPRLFNFPVDMWYATCLGTRPLAPGREYLPPSPLFASVE